MTYCTGINALFDNEWREAIKAIIDTWLIEQNHNRQSEYSYPTLDNDKVLAFVMARLNK